MLPTISTTACRKSAHFVRLFLPSISFFLSCSCPPPFLSLSPSLFLSVPFNSSPSFIVTSFFTFGV